MGGGKDRDDHEQSSSIQDPRLVPQETQEDPCPQGSSSLLGSPRARTTHEDDRTTWPPCWCLQEEGRLIFRSHSTTTDCSWERKLSLGVDSIIHIALGAFFLSAVVFRHE